MIPRLHVVTDDRVLERADFRSRAQEVLRAGGSELALHVRGPDRAGAELYGTCRALGPAARAAGATLLVNDRVDVGLVLELDGVHLGSRSLPTAEARTILGPEPLLGLSVHGVPQARAGEAGGADYLFVGTIFPSPSHPGRAPAGPERLRRVGAESRLSMIAIGGVEPERVAEALEAGAHGVAALSGVWDAEVPARAVETYRKALEEA